MRASADRVTPVTLQVESTASHTSHQPSIAGRGVRTFRPVAVKDRSLRVGSPCGSAYRSASDVTPINTKLASRVSESALSMLDCTIPIRAFPRVCNGAKTLFARCQPIFVDRFHPWLHSPT